MTQATRIDVKAWLQELKGNRRTQVSLAVLALVLVWALWPAPPKKRPTPRNTVNTPSTMDDRKLQSLEKLPNLAAMDHAAQLPSGDQPGRMYRDLVGYDMPPGPPPPPPKPVPPPPPPPPPTPEEIQARQLQESRNAENASKPQDLRYLGWFGNHTSGRLGAFMKGNEPMPMKPGATLRDRWKLTTLTADYAEFQNMKYPDIHHRIQVMDASRATNQPSHVTNNF